MELVNELYLAEERATRSAAEAVPKSLLADLQRDLVLLLAPFAPYLAHELWEMLGEKGSLLKAAWPKYDPALAKEDEIEIPVQVNGKLRSCGGSAGRRFGRDHPRGSPGGRKD